MALNQMIYSKCANCGGIRSINGYRFSGYPCLCDERHVDFINGYKYGLEIAAKELEDHWDQSLTDIASSIRAQAHLYDPPIKVS